MSRVSLGPHAFLYEACDIPPGITLAEFRSLRSVRREARRRITLARILSSNARRAA